jgi:D-alanyl-D-alanine dipeptidase
MRYNIIQRLNILVFTSAIFSVTVHAQPDSTIKNGIRVISSMDAYRASVEKDSNQRMVNLQFIPDIVLDLRYGTTNNFMKRVMYSEKPVFSFLRLPAAKALALVQQELLAKGYGLKIFDAYRPYFVTVKFWELVHDERYVADPKKGSGHNRGIAVDLSIIDLKTKQELVMPTGFDAFTDSAHHDFMNLSPEVLKNRKLLKETMEKYGFVEFATEWWHYSLPDPEKYEVLNLGFNELKKAN